MAERTDMTYIKMCGLTRMSDITAVNSVKPEYIGFVFYEKSKRYITPSKAVELKGLLSPEIKAVGVFVNESAEVVAGLLESGVIDIAQLHGDEDEEYISGLRRMTDKPIIQAFRIRSAADAERARQSSGDMILLDAGAGDGKAFDWSLISNIERPYFLAGGLSCQNVAQAVRELHPYGVDVSSGIETDGIKDIEKMAAFAGAVRKDNAL